MSNKNYPYPVQMASIKKNDWRLEEFINKGLDEKELEIEENKLWKRLKRMSKQSPKPPGAHPTLPGSKLIGHGWEWAVYKLSPREVVKVPSGTFQEVSEAEYLKNTEATYKVCRKHLGNFVVKTCFKRIQHDNKELNTLRQRLIRGEEIDFINPQKLPRALRNNLTKLARGMLVILEEHDWIPDMHLWRKKGKESGWNIWNLIIGDKRPIIFDFTAYYDVWRLYPQRTKKEKRVKGQSWRKFLSELQS